MADIRLLISYYSAQHETHASLTDDSDTDSTVYAPEHLSIYIEKEKRRVNGESSIYCKLKHGIVA